jgi:hypothetical protein
MSDRIKKMSNHIGQTLHRSWEWFTGTRAGRAVKWAIEHVKEPRVLSFLSWAGYVVLLVVGGYALFDPPTTITDAMGPYAMTVTAALVMAGALFGVIASLPGWRVVERLGIAMTLAGTSLYLVLLTILQFTGTGNRLFQAGFIFFALVSLIGRLVHIREGVFEPGSRASQRAQELHPSVTADTEPIPVIDDDE